MRNFIHRLRQKPEEQKKQIIMFILVIAMSLVVLIWLSTLGIKKEKSKKEVEETVPSPFTMLIESFSEALGGIKDSVTEADLSGMQKKILEGEKQTEKDPAPDEDYIEDNLFQ